MKFRQALFWDTHKSKIDTKKNAHYIIERILDFGNDKEARWILDFYGKSMIKKVITKSRCLRQDTKKLWSLILKKK